MIKCTDLTKKFNGKTAVDGISFYVPDGQIMALLGPNGAGKTTTVRMLACLISPDSGDAIVAGHSIRREKDVIRAQVGILTESPGLYDRMRVEEYLIFFARLYGIPASEIGTRVRRFLELFDLQDHRHKRIGTFSRGMKQKVALARALLHDPRVIFLDEPTSGLDPESAKIFRDYILFLKEDEKRTVLLCTHNLDEAERLSDWVGIIDHGRLKHFARTQEVMRGHKGPREFRVRCALDGGTPSQAWLEDIVRMVTQVEGVVWVKVEPQDRSLLITFSASQVEATNPRVLGRLLNEGIAVIACEESTRSLEDIYLETVSGATSTMRQPDR
ncbi:MAG TPA: ABC transporter ATP-binding protein [Firmicutes bacterium]|nr:ABC transporter ATP-binding protein [Bacillota bacterium]